MNDPSYMAIKYETLDQAHADLLRASSGIADNIHQLEKDLHASLSHWTGAAKDAYKPVKQKWDNAIADMNSVLQAAYLHLEKTAENYRAVEQRNASIWNP